MRRRLQAWIVMKDPSGSNYYTVQGPIDPKTGKMREVPVPVPPAQIPGISHHKIYSRRDLASSTSAPPSTSTTTWCPGQVPADTVMDNCSDWVTSPSKYTNRISSQAVPGSSPGKHGLGYSTTTSAVHCSELYQHRRSTSSATNASQSLLPSSRSSSISAASSDCPTSGSPNYPKWLSHRDTSAQRRPLYQAGSPISRYSQASTSHRPCSSIVSPTRHQGAHPRSEDSFHKVITAIFRPASNDHSIEIHFPQAKRSMEDLRKCMEPSIVAGRDFKILEGSDAKGSMQAILQFRNAFLAEKAAHELHHTRIGGVMVNVVHENARSYGRRSEPTHNDRSLKKNATTTGPIIIDGSRTD